MPYLIDGHNLIAALPDIDLADDNDEAQLVLKLRGFAARQKTKCAVVFDGGLPGGASRLSTSTVQVVFASAQRSDADSLIKRRIAKLPDPRNWTLVSSDRELRSSAHSRRMPQLSAQQFAELLRQPQQARNDSAETEKPDPSADDTELWLKQFGDP